MEKIFHSENMFTIANWTTITTPIQYLVCVSSLCFCLIIKTAQCEAGAVIPPSGEWPRLGGVTEWPGVTWLMGTDLLHRPMPSGQGERTLGQ